MTPRARITREARNDNSARGTVEFWIEATDEATALEISCNLNQTWSAEQADYIEETDYGFGVPYFIPSDEQGGFRADFQAAKKQILSN